MFFSPKNNKICCTIIWQVRVHTWWIIIWVICRETNLKKKRSVRYAQRTRGAFIINDFLRNPHFSSFLGVAIILIEMEKVAWVTENCSAMNKNSWHSMYFDSYTLQSTDRTGSSKTHQVNMSFLLFILMHQELIWSEKSPKFTFFKTNC